MKHSTRRRATALVVRLFHDLQERFRLWRGASGKPGSGERASLHLRRTRRLALSASRFGQEGVEPRHPQEIRRPEGILWGGRHAAGAGHAAFPQRGRRRRAGVVAIDKDTGRTLWTASEDPASHASAVSATFGEQAHVLFYTRTGLLGADPKQARFSSSSAGGPVATPRRTRRLR